MLHGRTDGGRLQILEICGPGEGKEEVKGEGLGVGVDR